jgi:enoyl-CoA hydratase/carnithine racemase
MSDAGFIRTRSGDGVVELTIDRPEKKNALSAAMYADLAAGLTAADDDPEVRAVVLTSVGDAFTAGNDIRDFAMNPPRGDDAPVARFLRAIATARKPLVAAVPGMAIGVGVTMLLHCDLVVAAETATFAMPFVDLGLVPEAASSLLFPRLIGYQRAAALLMLGERIDARRALELGFVNELSPSPDQARAAGIALARRLAAKPPEAMRLTKALMRDPDDNVLARLKNEGAIFSDRLTSIEAREAFARFLGARR